MINYLPVTLKICYNRFGQNYESNASGRVRSCCFRLDFSSFNDGNSRTCNARCKYAFEGALLVELEKHSLHTTRITDMGRSQQHCPGKCLEQ